MQLDTLLSFDFSPRTRIIFGVGAFDRLGGLVREFGGKRVLIVTDPGLVRAGHAARAESLLREAGLWVSIYDRVPENPTTSAVEECAAKARSDQIDFLVGLGGGSSIDAAKGCNFLLTNGGRMEDYCGYGKAQHAMLPMVAVPTTAGTGSECQSYALISQEHSHAKMACGDPKAAPLAAILDPLLTLSQPRRVAMAAGMDAICHAVESAVSRNRNPVSQIFSREAFRLCSQGLRGILADANDVTARGQMLLGASLAGMAIENSMLGAAHSAANPLTAHFDAVHGEAVGVMMPAVVRYNAALDECRTIYEDLVFAAKLADGEHDSAHAAELLANHLEELSALAGLPRFLSQWGVEEEDLEMLSEEAARQWTARFNPRPVEKRDFLELYRSTLRRGSVIGGAVASLPAEVLVDPTQAR